MQNVNPRALALKKTSEKVLAARKQPPAGIDADKMMADMKKRLGL